jgi:hypothetical protein
MNTRKTGHGLEISKSIGRRWLIYWIEPVCTAKRPGFEGRRRVADYAKCSIMATSSSRR